MNWSFICTIVIRCKNDGTSASWKPVLTYFFTLVVYFTLKLYFFFFKSGPFPASFLFIFVFSVQLIINKCSIKFCRWLEANRGPLVLKATALPTEPQPLPKVVLYYKVGLYFKVVLYFKAVLHFKAVLYYKAGLCFKAVLYFKAVFCFKAGLCFKAVLHFKVVRSRKERQTLFCSV